MITNKIDLSAMTVIVFAVAFFIGQAVHMMLDGTALAVLPLPLIVATAAFIGIGQGIARFRERAV